MQFSMSLFSSLGKKIFMGISGLLLSGFVVVHLLGNLALLNPDKDPFNKYAHFLTQGLGNFIYVAEFMLGAIFLIHFIYALVVQWGNWTARPSRYQKVTNAKNTSRKSIGSVTMIYTGIVVIIFLVLHLFHFKFGRVIWYIPQGSDHQIRDLYTIVYQFFGNIWNVIFYIAVMILLGFHLSHGVWSAFQSLGINGQRLTPVIHSVGLVFAVIMAIGFLFLPVWIFYMTGGAV